MKKLLCLLLLAPAIGHAQLLELGLAGGISTNTKPSDNMYYKGDKMTINYAGTLSVLYNLSTAWQVGIQAHITELSMKSDKIYPFYKGGNIGGDDKRFVYAKTAVSFCGVFNGKLMMKNGYGYGGVALGYGVGRHNSKELGSNESYRAPDGGNGLVFGAQLGYVLGLSKRFALNAEAAMRYYSLKYSAQAPGVTPAEDLKYSIMSFPVTIGIRYQLFDDVSKEKERQDSMNIGGE